MWYNRYAMSDAAMAQLVERILGKDEVISSTLISSSKGLLWSTGLPHGGNPVFLCRCVGIGRRDGLKIHCQRWRAGSSPATGTMKNLFCHRQKRFFSEINPCGICEMRCAREIRLRCVKCPAGREGNDYKQGKMSKKSFTTVCIMETVVVTASLISLLTSLL